MRIKKLFGYALASILIALAAFCIVWAIHAFIYYLSHALQGWILLIWSNVIFWLGLSFLIAYGAYKLLPSKNLAATLQTPDLGALGRFRADMGGAIVIFIVFVFTLYLTVFANVLQEIYTNRNAESVLRMEQLQIPVKLIDENGQPLDETIARDMMAKHANVLIQPKPFETGRRNLITVDVPVRENTNSELAPTSNRWVTDLFDSFLIQVNDPDNENSYYTTGNNYKIGDFEVVRSNTPINHLQKLIQRNQQDCDLSQGVIHVNRNEGRAFLDCFITLRRRQQ